MKKKKNSKLNPEEEVVIHGPTLYMRESDSKAFLKREFLNDASSLETSFVLGVVANSHKGQIVSGFNAAVLCDSTRIICLEFPLASAKCRSASIYKIGILLSTLQKFREALLFEATAIENAGEGVDQ
jgi:hypothetical protein